jgi:hypothetical protein
VAVVAVCADLTRGKGGLNTVSGLIATALLLGGVVGPLGAGLLLEHLGFNMAFDVFAGVAAVAASPFVGWMLETAGSVHARLRQRGQEARPQVVWGAVE